MAAEHNHVIGKEASRFCHWRGVLAFWFFKTESYTILFFCGSRNIRLKSCLVSLHPFGTRKPMRMQKVPFALSRGIFALLAVLTGCTSVEKNYPEKRYFILDVSRSGNSLPRSGTVLRVLEFRVSPRYKSKVFVYRKGNLSYEFDFYNQFLVSPSPLITEEVTKWLARTGLFQHVVGSASHMEITHLLEGTINALYGDYSEKRSPKAVLEIQFVFIKDLSAASKIVFQKEYRKEIAIKVGSPEALVEGWNEALRQIFTVLEKDLRRADLLFQKSA